MEPPPFSASWMADGDGRAGNSCRDASVEPNTTGGRCDSRTSGPGWRPFTPADNATFSSTTGWMRRAWATSAPHRRTRSVSVSSRGDNAEVVEGVPPRRYNASRRATVAASRMTTRRVLSPPSSPEVWNWLANQAATSGYADDGKGLPPEASGRSLDSLLSPREYPPASVPSPSTHPDTKGMQPFLS